MSWDSSLSIRRSTTASAPPSTKQGIRHARDQALHISLVVAWFAGLFYLPRIFVNLAMVPADSAAERERLLLMAGKLYRFMTPLGILAVGLGLWLWFGYGFTGGWLHAKTALVTLLIFYHLYCGQLLRAFIAGTCNKEPCLVPLVQRTAGAGTVRHRLPRHPQTFLMNNYFAPCPRDLEALLADDVVAHGGQHEGRRRCHVRR